MTRSAPESARRANHAAADDAGGDFVEVAIDVPVYDSFTYRLPGSMRATARPGARVLVPFRGRPRTGLVVARTGPPEDTTVLDKVVDVADLLDDEPVLSTDLVQLITFAARYYQAPLGEFARTALPANLRVGGRRQLSITTAGLAALDAGVITDAIARRFMEELAASDSAIVADDLRSRIRGLTFVMMRRAEKAGWVVSEYQASSDRGIKTETFVRLLRDPYKDERLGAQQEAILLSLQSRPTGQWLSLTLLREEAEAPRSSLKSLAKRGIVELEDREIYRDPFAGEPARPPEDFELTPDQASAVGAVRAKLEEGGFGAFLLHGVTGSGKTEVYLRLIRSVVAQQRRALVLLPEISLTPQFVAVFRGHFGHDIAVLHSGLSDGERYDEWRRIRRGEVHIVIGARSALFAPIRDLGIVIVDEEHDHSFKQESAPRYHARDLAQARARYAGAIVVLGSATPSVETYQNAREGRVGYLPMATRVAERQLPQVHLVDLRDKTTRLELDGLPDARVLSRPLAEAIGKTLEAGEQTILFLNRRGHSPYVHCRACGRAWECHSCSVTLTYHKGPHQLVCHYCDHSEPAPSECPDCGSLDVGLLGMGTQKLENVLEELYPGARLARLDRDTGRQLRAVIRAFRRREVDILVGTQMVTKGHDFPHVTLVGVILADMSLRFPDFRAGERTFQLLTQVAGRAGRGQRAGRVIVQTYSPWHYALMAAQKHSYTDFVQHELNGRRDLTYPPFGALASIVFEGRHESQTKALAARYGQVGQRVLHDVGVVTPPSSDQRRHRCRDCVASIGGR